MKKQDQIIKNLVARTQSLGGTYSRIDYQYAGIVSLRLEIGESFATVCIGPRGALQYVSTWFEGQHGGWISTSDKDSRPRWAKGRLHVRADKASDLRAWFWNVSRDMHGHEGAVSHASDFHKTASTNFTDKMVAA